MTVSKVDKLLRLLSSSVDGEVVAAARALERTLATMSLDYNDFAGRVTDMLTKPNGSTQPIRDDGPTWTDVEGDDQDKIMQCASHIHEMNTRNAEFIQSVKRQYARKKWLSSKQRDWLEDIYRKHCRAA